MWLLYWSLTDMGVEWDGGRGNWEFDGYVVSDCDAIDVMQNDHNYTKTPEETCGAAMAAGTDLNCGTFYNNLDLAVAVR